MFVAESSKTTKKKQTVIVTHGIQMHHKQTNKQLEPKAKRKIQKQPTHTNHKQTHNQLTLHLHQSLEQGSNEHNQECPLDIQQPMEFHHSYSN